MWERIKTRWLTIELDSSLQYWLLAAITLLAAALRFYKLGEWSFWWDEMFTYRDVVNVSSFSLIDQRVSRILITLVVGALGWNEWSSRLVPALFGILTIPILYFPTRKIFGPAVALLASLFLAISPWHIYWSQNARFYTIVLLFYSLAMFAFYFGIERDKPWYLLAFFVFLGLAVQERLFALFLVPVIVIYWLVIKALPFEKPAGMRNRNLGLLVVPSLIAGAFVGREFTFDPAKWFEQFAWVNNNPFWILSGVVYYIGIPVMVMAFLAAIALVAKKDRPGLMLGLSAVVPLLAVMALSMIQFTANRYVFVSLTSWIILSAVAVRDLLAGSRGGAKLLALGALAILVIEPVGENVLYYSYQHGNRDNWRAAFEMIERFKEPGDKIIVDNTRIGNYYMGEETLPVNWVDFDSLKVEGERFWFVEDMNIQDKYPPEIMDWIRKNTRMVGNFDVSVRARNFRMRVYLFDPEAP